MLLPDFRCPICERELEKLGFHRFFETTDSVKHTVSGPKGELDVMIIALRAPADGPIGDSGLIVDDGETVAFNMNDARPVDLDVVHADFGHVDVHMLQYSGAIWYPMVYDMPARAKEAFGTQKRQRQMDRCRQYISQVGATWVVPSAGPPCFLDPELRDLNDDHDDPANIFPDQMVFLDQMRTHGHDGGVLLIPGSTADFTGSQCNSVIHPLPDDEVHAIFTTGKADYIADYAERMAPVLAAEKARWAPAGGDSLLEPLRAKFEPIMSQSDQICDGIGYPVELRMGAETVVSGLPETSCPRTDPAREVPLRIRDRPRVGAHRAARRRTRLGQHDLPVDALQGVAGRRLQRVPVHVLQVPDRRTHRLCRRLVRRSARRLRVDRTRRLPHAAPMPAPEGRPLEVRRGGGLNADLQSAWLAMESEQRQVPDIQGPRTPLRARMSAAPRQYYDDGLIQLDQEAITLRRYHFPSGTSKIIPLRSIRGYKAEPLGMLTQRFRIWGSSDLRRWLPLDIWRPIKSTLVTLDVVGAKPKPAFTPQRPTEFLAKLDELLESR